MKNLVKCVLFWLLAFTIALTSCQKHDPYEDTPDTACPGGDCEYSFKINPQQQPNAYLDGNGYWHVYTEGMSYFQIIGELEEPHDFYHINDIPDVSVAMDSDYWITFDGITFKILQRNIRHKSCNFSSKVTNFLKSCFGSSSITEY